MRKNFILILSLIAIIAILSSCSNDKNTQYSTTEEGNKDDTSNESSNTFLIRIINMFKKFRN